jgi:hypothetical protein
MANEVAVKHKQNAQIIKTMIFLLVFIVTPPFFANVFVHKKASAEYRNPPEALDW